MTKRMRRCQKANRAWHRAFAVDWKRGQARARKVMERLLWSMQAFSRLRARDVAELRRAEGA